MNHTEGMSVAVDREEYYYSHTARSRGIQSKQYVYEIGSYHYNWHPDLEVLLVLSGEIEVCADGEASRLSAGDLTVINSRAGHATLATEPRSIALLLHLNPQFLASFQPDGRVPVFECRSTPLTVRTPPFATLRRAMAQMMLNAPHDAAPASVAEYERSILGVVVVLLKEFSARGDRPGVPDDPLQDQAFRRVTEYVERHYSERIPLKKLGEIAGYNAVYLSQLFTEKLGMTTSEYIRRVRLAHAVRALTSTTDRIGDIAHSHGFADVKAFNVAFDRAFRKTPSQYRSLLQERAPEFRAVDDAFHQKYASRSDPLVTASLQEFARQGSPVECGECVPVGIPTLPRLEVSVQTARELLRQLETLGGHEAL